MTPTDFPAIWKVAAPATWPVAPTEMTVTTLLEIESCPRRWGLAAADYPEVWTGRGFPPRFQLRALAGMVVHMSLETITGHLIKSGCGSVQDAGAIQVMRMLGGYTKVVDACIDRVLATFVDNPRAKHLMEFATRSLRNQVGELRTRTQTMVSRIRLPATVARRGAGIPRPTRGPLKAGVFPELSLRATQIGWKGKADLLILSPDVCELTDFKTGAATETHRLQIETYALLWSRDVELNPEARLVERLVLAYSRGNVVLPGPTGDELNALQVEMVARREAAIAAVSQLPPEARPDPSSCLRCGVRPLCEDYWMPATQLQMAANQENQFLDIEVTITGRRGTASWDAIVERSAAIERGRPLLLQADHLPVLPRAGYRMRLLSVHLAETPRDESGFDPSHPVIVNVGAGSEAFIVSPA